MLEERDKDVTSREYIKTKYLKENPYWQVAGVPNV